MVLKHWRKVAAVVILAVTAAAFLYYFHAHPEVWWQLQKTSLALLVWLIFLYLLITGALALVVYGTTRLCKIRLKLEESWLLATYTAIINFFGPLQSGPAFRAVYLKKKHGLSLGVYTVATLVYLFFWGIVSVLFLFSGILKWWIIPIAIATLILAHYATKTRFLAHKLEGIDMHGIRLIMLAVLIQIGLLVAINYSELRTVAPGTSWTSTVIYTGAANLALFVSITPGAIGFRESFLLLSQNLSHVKPESIVAASTLDRAAYIVTLLILAAFIFGLQAQKSLRKGLGQSPSSQ